MLHTCVQKLMWMRETKKNLQFGRKENQARVALQSNQIKSITLYLFCLPPCSAELISTAYQPWNSVFLSQQISHSRLISQKKKKQPAEQGCPPGLHVRRGCMQGRRAACIRMRGQINAACMQAGSTLVGLRPKACSIYSGLVCFLLPSVLRLRLV
jgi:hypothetical protein